VYLPKRVSTDFQSIGPELASRLGHALYLAERWGVVSFTMTLDRERGFDAELVYRDAPPWRRFSVEFNDLEDAVMQQLIEYVYEQRLKPRDPDEGILSSIEQMTATDFEELHRAWAADYPGEPSSAPIYSLKTWIALGTCVCGGLGFLFAMVLSSQAHTALWQVAVFGGTSVLLLGVAAGIVLGDLRRSRPSTCGH
jgi:hypothetical protein